jgi:hypothetical protein
MGGSLSKTIALTIIYANAFFIGAIIMGFEMLASRYLYPYFGGGIGTWAGLISTVLGALTIGYFLGGLVIDRNPSAKLTVVATGLAAAYLSCLPISADPLISLIQNAYGDGPGPILLASAALLLVPLSALGMFSPIAIRLLIRSMHESGRVAGAVYGVSTLGSIFGTLFTTFALIPSLGSRAITYLFAGVLVVCALTLLILPSHADQRI